MGTSLHIEEAGFSLLETLFALAIMSLASVALFQSTSSMLSLSDRAVKAGERIVSSSLDRRALSGVIDGFLPSWPDEGGMGFTGSARRFSGLSANSLSAEVSGPEFVTVVLREDERGADRLLYSSQSTSETGTEFWDISRDLPGGARFEYMGVNHKWYDAWPPREKPARGFFNEAALLPDPLLPQAIRLRSGKMIIRTARISRAMHAPDRFDSKAGL